MLKSLKHNNIFKTSNCDFEEGYRSKGVSPSSYAAGSRRSRRVLAAPKFLSLLHVPSMVRNGPFAARHF